MSNIVRHYELNLDAAMNSGLLGRRVPPYARRRVQQVIFEGLATGIRTQLLGDVANLAVSEIGTLSRMEAHILDVIPLEDMNTRLKVESRLRLVVDTYTTGAATQLARLAR